MIRDVIPGVIDSGYDNLTGESLHQGHKAHTGARLFLLLVGLRSRTRVPSPTHRDLVLVRTST